MWKSSFSQVKSIFRIENRLSSTYTFEDKIYSKNIVLFEDFSVLSNGSSNFRIKLWKKYLILGAGHQLDKVSE